MLPPRPEGRGLHAAIMMTVSPGAERVTESFIDGELGGIGRRHTRTSTRRPGHPRRRGAGGGQGIDQAVTAARRASRAWRPTTPEQRSELLSRLADLIDGEVETLARLESEDTGKPLSQARNDARVCARYFRFYSHVIESYYGLSIPLRPDLHVYTRREPLGVTGHIVAWNYPMQLFGRGVAARHRHRELRGAEAGRRDAAHRRLPGPAGDRRLVCRPAWSTWSPGSGRRPAPRSPPTRASTTSASSGPPRSAA